MEVDYKSIIVDILFLALLVLSFLAITYTTWSDQNKSVQANTENVSTDSEVHISNIENIENVTVNSADASNANNVDATLNYIMTLLGIVLIGHIVLLVKVCTHVPHKVKPIEDQHKEVT